MIRANRRNRQAGSTSVQMLAIMVPVLFAFIGFAVDLGRLYLVRGELQTAADARALAAAGKLIGTEDSIAKATEQAQLTVVESNSLNNRYNFGEITLGQGTGFLSNEVPEPSFFASLAAATGDPVSGGEESGGGTARYARVTIRAEAPLLFFGFLSVAQERKTPIEVAAVAGMSAPVCMACSIEPIAVAALDSADDVNYGFVAGTRYTFGYQCTGAPPGQLNGPRVPYVLLNRFNEQTSTVFADEQSQAFRSGAQGLPPSNVLTPADSTQPYSCLTIGVDESIWVTAAPAACAGNVSATARAFACGLANRFDVTVPAACATIAEVDSMASLYAADSDLNDLDDYTTYTGTGRRLITIPIVTAISAADPMQIVAFRQFLVQPTPNLGGTNPADNNGRFVAMYLGTVAPVKQGRLGSCAVTSGPGKVVLHR